MKKYKSILNIYSGFVFAIFSLNVLAILAPILLHFGFEYPAKMIYTLFSFFCHQQAWKTIHIFDNQMAWCARDTFIWLAVLVTSIVVKIKKPRPINWKIFVLFALPIALDGGIQTIASILGYSSSDPFYVSNNLFRMLTGGIFGVGIGLLIFPYLLEVIDVDYKPVSRYFYLKILVLVMSAMLLIYMGLVHVWKITSSDALPSNFLDSEIKIPSENKDWFVRRENGV